MEPLHLNYCTPECGLGVSFLALIIFKIGFFGYFGLQHNKLLQGYNLRLMFYLCIMCRTVSIVSCLSTTVGCLSVYYVLLNFSMILCHLLWKSYFFLLILSYSFGSYCIWDTSRLFSVFHFSCVEMLLMFMYWCWPHNWLFL